MNTPVFHFTSIGALRRHPKFEAAKAGDIAAAREIVRTFVKNERVKHLKNVVLCPVIAVEAAGANLLPLIMAQYIAGMNRLRVETEIVQSNRTHHTDANAVHRLLHRPTFEGDIAAGDSYIVIDDVTTTGSTIQELRLHIQRHGGHVAGFCVLAGSYCLTTGSSLVVDQIEATRSALRKKFGPTLDEFLRRYGIADTAAELTNSQARYLLSFKNLDTLSDKLNGQPIPQRHQTLSQLDLALA